MTKKDDELQILQRRVDRLEQALIALIGWDEYEDTGPPGRPRPSFLRPKSDDAFHEHLYYLIKDRWCDPFNYWGELVPRLSQLQEEIKTNAEVAAESRRDTNAYLALLTMGIDLTDTPLRRYIPVRAYLSEGDSVAVDSLTKALRELAEAFGFVVSDEFPPELGSWYQKLFMKTKDLATQPEVADRLNKIEKALELQGIDKPQADVDKAKSEAVVNLAKAADGQKQAAMQCGSILLVKTTAPNGESCMQVRTLTQRELAYLEKHQAMLKSPDSVLERLSQLAAADGNPPQSERSYPEVLPI